MRYFGTIIFGIMTLAVTAGIIVLAYKMALAGKGGGIINYIVNGQITFQPDYRDRIPIQTIEHALMDLCIQFGVTNAMITRGMAWRDKKSPTSKTIGAEAAPQPQR